MKLTVTLSFVLFTFAAFAQYPEYRITDDGQYQYLANKGTPGSVLDETRGTVYKPVTIRTFFLEVQAKGYLEKGLSYEEFNGMSIEEQRDAVKQPFAKPLDCSIGQSISEACLVYHARNMQYEATNESATSTSGGTRIPIKTAPRDQVETVKLILHEK